MSILRGDFAPDQVAAIEDAMERTGLPFSSVVRMLIDYGINARRGFRRGSESLPGETSKEEGEGESLESQDPTERKGSGGNSESISLPDTPEQVRAKARDLRTRNRIQALPIPDPPAEIDSPELRAFLPEFAEYRRKVKKAPPSPAGWNLLFNRLKPAGRDHAVLALRYSISNGWKSFDVEWLKGKSWATVASELGLSLETQKPAPSLADLAVRRLSFAIRDAETEIGKLAPASDGWTGRSRAVFFDGLSALKSEAEVAAHLTACRAVCDRLRASGAYPLRRSSQPGEILPAGGGARVVVDLRDGGWVGDAACPACGEDESKGPCSCGVPEPYFPPPICGCGFEQVEYDDGHACPVCEIEFLTDKEFEGQPALASGLSSEELALIDPPNPDFFNALSKLPPLDVSGFGPVIPKVITEKQRAKVADGQHAYTYHARTGKCLWCQQDEDHIRHYQPQQLPFGEPTRPSRDQENEDWLIGPFKNAAKEES